MDWSLYLLKKFVCFCHLPSGIGRGVGWSRDLGISRAGEGIDEVFSMRGKGDSLLLETLAAVLPSRECPGIGLGLLHKGKLGLNMPLDQLPKEIPSNEPPDFTLRKRRKNKRREMKVNTYHIDPNIRQSVFLLK